MSQAAPTSGSNTITLTNNVPKDDQQADVTKKVLKLKSKKNVKWDESTAIDNEGMGKKSSKKCCIYHKPRAFGESDSESEEEDHICDHDH